MDKNPARGVVWDLSSLYSGPRDLRIARDKHEIERLVSTFTRKYKGKISSATAKVLLHAIGELEALEEKLYIYASFASYLHSLDTKDPKIGKFFQEAEEFTTRITGKLLWFKLEIQALPNSSAQKLVAARPLKEYSHYLKHLRAFSAFRKSLPEEEIITKMSLSGASAFVRFYDETSASETFSLGSKVLGYSELAAVLKDHPDGKTRKEAAKAMANTYNGKAKFYTFTLNTLLLDKKLSDEIRGYKYPQQATFLNYEVDPKTVESLVKTVENNYPLVERYYKLKSKILKRKLFEWDRYSQVFYGQAKNTISWQDATNTILTSFSDFDAEFGHIAKIFFDNGWIDARLRKNKRAGAFCSYCVPSKNPYILLNYTGTVDDVSTLAHELGHGIHAYLSRNNTLVNYFPSTATAEIASVFCESLVFEHLYKKAKSDKERLNLLANKIQGGFATIFRQIAFYQFESVLHKHRRERGELATGEINDYFQGNLQKMFGAGLTLTQNHKHWWMPVLHFYHYNFYVFTYAFGEALSLALYSNYKSGGAAFVENYKKALTSGGSATPKEITKKMGVDIANPHFWQKGIDLLSEYVDEFERLASKAVK